MTKDEYIENLRHMIEEAEWIHQKENSAPECPWCSMRESDGHKDDCPTHMALPPLDGMKMTFDDDPRPDIKTILGLGRPGHMEQLSEPEPVEDGDVCKMCNGALVIWKVRTGGPGIVGMSLVQQPCPICANPLVEWLKKSLGGGA